VVTVVRGVRWAIGGLLLAAGLTVLVPGTAAAQAAALGPGVRAAAAGSILTILPAGDDGRPVARLTNTNPWACRVAASALGSVTVVSAGHGDAGIEPVAAELAFAEEPRDRIATTLKVLQPRQSTELRLPVVPRGGTRHLLTAKLATSGGSTAWLHPVTDGRTLGLTLRYELPVTPPDGGPPACDPATGSGDVDLRAPTGADPVPWVPIAVAGGAGVVVVAAGVLLFRHRRARTAVMAAVLAGAVLHGVATAPDAAAEIVISPGQGTAYGACAQAFGGPRGDPAGIFGVLTGGGVHVTILAPEPDERGISNYAVRHPNGDVTISWNSVPSLDAEADDLNDVCGALYHELFHAWEYAQGGTDHRECITSEGPTGIEVTEVNAARAEDLFRTGALGLEANGMYGSRPLPDGPCLPPPPEQRPPACSGSCGSSYADPHLDTFDNRHYSFQAVGEFVAARDARGGLEVQVRQQPAIANRLAARNTAVAVRLGRGRFEVHQDADAGSATVLVAGRATSPATTVRLPGGGTLRRERVEGRELVTGTGPDGSVVRVHDQGQAGLRLDVQPAAARRGRLEGLLGDFDGRPENDLRTPGGAPLGPGKPAHDDLYPRFADGWRVVQARSLFTYAPGTSTETFTDLSFPDRAPEPGDLPGWQAAQALCRSRGVTEPVALEDCAFDVAITGDASYAAAAASAQAVRGALGVDGAPTTVRVGPGAPAELSFTGTAGQAVTLSVVADDGLGTDCGALRVLDAAGDLVARGCLATVNGGIDAPFELPADGTYRVVVAPADGKGAATLTLSSVTTIEGELRPGGPPVDVDVDRPGRATWITFDGTAGQRLHLAAPGSLPVNCGTLVVLDPASRRVAEGCMNGDRGEVDTFALTRGGRHTLVVDPTGPVTGRLRLTLVAVADSTGTIAVNGPPVRATITTPGGSARLTFEGTAGRDVTIAARTGDLPLQCGVLMLLDPAGQVVGSGCVVEDRGGIRTTRLAVTGRYTVLLDPAYTTTGSADVEITG
jgi:hypothetical protein